jgi:phage tail protein X
MAYAMDRFGFCYHGNGQFFGVAVQLLVAVDGICSMEPVRRNGTNITGYSAAVSVEGLSWCWWLPTV